MAPASRMASNDASAYMPDWKQKKYGLKNADASDIDSQIMNKAKSRALYWVW